MEEPRAATVEAVPPPARGGRPLLKGVLVLLTLASTLASAHLYTGACRCRDRQPPLWTAHLRRGANPRSTGPFPSVPLNVLVALREGAAEHCTGVMTASRGW